MSETIQIRNQLGAATLVVALVLLLAITLMTFSGVKVGINEQRMATNEVAYREALETAQGALDFGLAYLEDNKNAMNGWGWSACASSTAVPCGNGFANLYSSGGPLPGNWLGFVPSVSLPGLSNNYNYTLGFVTPSSGGLPAANPVVTIVARATNNSDPSVGTTLRQTVKGYPITVNPPAWPVIAKSAVDVRQKTYIWANESPTPDQSIWSNSSVTLASGPGNSGKEAKTCTGTATATCNTLSGGSSGCTTSSSPYCGTDISVSSFPADLFKATFGISASDYQILKNEVTILNDCSSFNTNPQPPAGLYWIAGSCILSDDANTAWVVGSSTSPYVLVVEGVFTLERADIFYGIVFLKADASDTLDRAVIVRDSELYGALISEDTAPELMLGPNSGQNSRYIIYDATTLNNARNLAGNFAKAPGGWTDQ